MDACVSQQARAIGDGRRADGVLTRDHATPGWGHHPFAVPLPVARAQTLTPRCCGGAWSPRLTVTQEITGSNPVYTAAVPDDSHEGGQHDWTPVTQPGDRHAEGHGEGD